MRRTLTPVAEGSGAQVVTLDEAKAHLRLTHDTEDDTIMAEIDAAISWAEDFAVRPIRRSQYLLTLDDFQMIEHRQSIRILGYVYSVDSVQYRDSNGTLQTIDGPSASPGPAVYEVLKGQHSTLIGVASGQSWPALHTYMDAIRVTFTAGWIATDVPYQIRQAILLKLGSLHRRRAPGDDADGGIDAAAQALLLPWKLPVWV